MTTSTMFDCTTPKYDDLYSRWLDHPRDLLDYGSLKPGQRMLDLCGDTGILAREALDMGVSQVHLLDLNPRCPDPRVHQFRGTAESSYGHLPGHYDLIVCRQALGYIDLPRLPWAILTLLKPTGVFVFNNFNQPKWGHSTYFHRGNKYFEASGFWGHKVGHIQVGKMGLDLTFFQWWEHKQILDAFNYFDVEFREFPKSTWYRVTNPRHCLAGSQDH